MSQSISPMRNPSSSDTTTAPTPPDATSDSEHAKEFADAEKGQAGPVGPDEHQAASQAAKDRQKQEENNLVGWDGPDDPENPMNWSKKKKYTVTVFYATLTFCLTFASTVFSTATMVTAKLFGVSNEVMTLGTGLFVLGWESSQYPRYHIKLTRSSGLQSDPLYGDRSQSCMAGDPLSSSASSVSPFSRFLSLSRRMWKQ